MRANRDASQCAGFHKFVDENGEQYGSFEVFYQDDSTEDGMEAAQGGWYWWSAFPGCLPDGEPCGPFPSSRDALRDARNL